MEASESSKGKGVVDDQQDASASSSGGLLYEIYSEITSSYINLFLVLAILFLVYKILKGRAEGDDSDNSSPSEPPIPKMKKQDMTLEQLRKFDGTQPDGRVLCAINGKVFDVTKGKRFYGPGRLVTTTKNQMLFCGRRVLTWIHDEMKECIESY
jgi:membrane-associated progesterone receptor component